FRACSASRSPSSIRSFRSDSIREIGLNAKVQMIARNTTKFVAAMITWKKLIWNSASPSAFVPRPAAPCATPEARARKSTVGAPIRTGYALGPVMKIASRPTTIARTPRPSANAARMIARPRIWPAASGLRPIAWDDSPARMPMPIPGPMTPIAARPAPMCSIRCSSCVPGRSARVRSTWVAARRAAGSVGGLELLRLRPLRLSEDLFGEMPLLLVMALDGQRDEDQRQDAEDQGLDRVEQE